MKLSADLSTTCFIRSIDTAWASKLGRDEARLARIEASLFTALLNGMSQTEAQDEINWRAEHNEQQLGRTKAFRALTPGQRRCLATGSALAATVNRLGVDLVNGVVASVV